MFMEYMYPVLDALRMVYDIGVTANKDAKAMAVVHTTALLETVVGFCGDLYGLWELAGLALLVVMLSMLWLTVAVDDAKNAALSMTLLLVMPRVPWEVASLAYLALTLALLAASSVKLGFIDAFNVSTM